MNVVTAARDGSHGSCSDICDRQEHAASGILPRPPWRKLPARCQNSHRARARLGLQGLLAPTSPEFLLDLGVNFAAADGYGMTALPLGRYEWFNRCHRRR